MTPRDFSHVHVSGYWNATARQWRVAARYARLCSTVATFTETTKHNPETPRTWGAWHGFERPGANECSVIWDRAVWRRVGRGFAVPLTRTPFALGNGKPRPAIHAIGVPLQHRAARRVVVFVAVHTPSAVEGRNGLVRGVRRAQTYTEVLAGLVKLRTRMRRLHPGCAFVVGGDWNLNLRLPWVRALLRAGMPGLRSSWRRMPARGTHGHGRRVIDDARHSRGVVTKGSRLLRRPGGFDHTPVRTAYRFRPSRRINERALAADLSVPPFLRVSHIDFDDDRAVTVSQGVFVEPDDSDW